MIFYFLLANLVGDTALGGYGPRSNRSKRNTNHRHRARGDAEGRPKAFKTGKGSGSVATRPPDSRGPHRPANHPPEPLRTDEKSPGKLSDRVAGSIRKGGGHRKDDIPPTTGGPHSGGHTHREDDGLRFAGHCGNHLHPRGDGDPLAGWSRVVGRCASTGDLFGEVGRERRGPRRLRLKAGLTNGHPAVDKVCRGI